MKELIHTNALLGKQLLARPWLLHLMYWLFLPLFFGLFWGSVHGDYGNHIFSEFVLLPMKMATVYSFLNYLIPRFLLRHRYVYFAVGALAALLAMSTLQRVIAYAYLHPWKAFDPNLGMFNIYEIMHQAININTAMIVPIGVGLLSIWTKKQLEAKELERQKMEVELKFLKNQMQPHFLFNTLNSLYGLILKKSDNAQEVVLMLSELMRYTLYETNVGAVALSKEIQQIQHFIALEQIRYGTRLDVGFRLHGDPNPWKIAPMLLLHFVENSFKHGLSNIAGWVTIDIDIQGPQLVFKVENGKPTEAALSKHLVSGIGLENVRRQLNLLYAGRYQLKIEDSADSYLVVLKIELA